MFLVVDLVLVVVGSQLWKRANHLDPASKENKVAYWVQTELGVIIAVIAFAPVILLMLNNKDLDPKAKKLCSIVAGVALVAAVGSGIDYHPTSQEDLDQAQAGAAVLSDDGLAYWTPFGKKYHFNPDCQYLKNSGTIYSGSVQDAIDAGRNEGCSGCTVEDGTDVLDVYKRQPECNMARGNGMAAGSPCAASFETTGPPGYPSPKMCIRDRRPGRRAGPKAKSLAGGFRFRPCQGLCRSRAAAASRTTAAATASRAAASCAAPAPRPYSTGRMPSSIRFTLSTLTRSSPKTPN